MDNTRVLATTLQALSACKLPALRSVAGHLKQPAHGLKAVLHDRVAQELTSRLDAASFRSDCAAILLICGVPVTFPLSFPQAAPAPRIPAAPPGPLKPPTLIATAAKCAAATWNVWLPGSFASAAYDRRGCPCGTPHAPVGPSAVVSAAASPPAVKCVTPGCAAKYHPHCAGLPPSSSSSVNWRCTICRAAGMMPFAEVLQVSLSGVVAGQRRWSRLARAGLRWVVVSSASAMRRL
jgi:hypothetical protein